MIYQIEKLYFGIETQHWWVQRMFSQEQNPEWKAQLYSSFENYKPHKTTDFPDVDGRPQNICKG